MERSETSGSQGPARSRGRSYAWFTVGAITLLVSGLLAYALLTGSAEPIQPGSQAPDFELGALDGTPMKLSAQRGKVVVLNVFASWCDPCRQEAADLQQAWQKYQGRGVQFLGIAYKDAAAAAQAFLNEFGVTYPSAIDPGNRTARAYGVTGVPETFVIDREGNLVHHFVGPVTEAQLSQEIDRLLGQ